MKNLITHPQFGEIRMKTKAGEPWFCAKDICEVLDLEWKRGLIVRYSLDENEATTAKLNTAGGMQEMVLVNESGMYQLIFQSRKPEARKFRKWVTSEVLPSIRKYGFYSTDEKAISRAEVKAERQKVLDMLKAIRENLSITDIRLVAKQCRATEWQVQRVLSGEVRDAYMLGILYTRSTGNKILGKQFYTASGAEKLMEKLKNQ